MRILPLILFKLNQNITEAAIKYFLTQSIASVLLIFIIFIKINSTLEFSLDIKNILLTVMLLIKMGAAPFHFWFPQITKLINWAQCFILFSWQKIAPLILICFLGNKVIIFTSLISSLVGAFGGLNSNRLKILITYSSISHSGWIVFSCLINLTLLATYFLIYIIISLSLIYFFSKKKINLIKTIQWHQLRNFNRYALILSILSLAGIPPLAGFFPKLIALLFFIKINIISILRVMIASAALSIFFYTRIFYTTILAKNNTNKIYFYAKENFSAKMPLAIHIFINLTIPIFMFYL